MLEILELSREIDALLEARDSAPMSEDEFEAQKRSFVIGNAFDVYPDSDTINEAKITELHQGRLDRAQ